MGVNGTLNLLLGKLTTLLAGANPLDAALLTPVVNTLTATINGLTTGLPDVIDARVIPTVGVGVGAFAAAMAYKQVLAQLASQPGGLDYTGTDPLLGSLTILPLILINNPGRPDGGAISRFGALASLLGISSVNPTTSLTGSGGVAGPLGLHVAVRTSYRFWSTRPTSTSRCRTWRHGPTPSPCSTTWRRGCRPRTCCAA